MRGLPLAVRVAAVATAVVALGSATLSWDALRWGAGQLGVDPALTWIYPVVVDGTILVGTVAALALRTARRRVRLYVWTLLGAAIAVSVVGNAAHAAGDAPLHRLGSAVPAAALAASLHLLVVIVRGARAEERTEERSRSAPPPAPRTRRRRTADKVLDLQQAARSRNERLTGDQVAKALGISSSYARKLLGRARAGAVSA
jgi:hypothetical protein